jgi:hypothetical protein
MHSRANKLIHNIEGPSWMESKGAIPGKIALREELDCVFPFKTRNRGASTTTKARKNQMQLWLG